MKDTIDYRQLSDSLRSAVVGAALGDLKAGASMKDVAEKYGTTIMTIHRWSKKNTTEFKHRGRPTETPKGTHRKPATVNYRVLPKALVEIAKSTALTRVKAGDDLVKVADDFGITKLTLTKWVEASK